MLNKLPKWTGELSEILADLGNPSSAKVAKALGVSTRTVERWKRGKTPRVALLSLWWLSREGYGTWDAEMANRTALTAQWNAALWRELGKRRHQGANYQPANVSRSASAANEPAFSPAQGRGPLGPTWG